jgi:hypothetical protein
MLRYDLGGVGKGGPRLTVNLNTEADLEQDFINLDAYCQDGTVDEFFLSHSLEHVPSPCYSHFLTGLWRKLKPGGQVKVVQTDVSQCLALHQSGALSFRALRTVIFPPADRLRANRHGQHYNMWGGAELAEDFRRAGFAPVEEFDAGNWALDTLDELHPGEVEKFHGTPIPNLGVVAHKTTASLPCGQAVATTAGGIPKVIHQTWRTKDVPPVFRREWAESWRRLNPAWEYVFWTDEDIFAFIRDRFPEFIPVFESYDQAIKRVDAWRYLLLKEVGGVYADLDSACLQPLDSWCGNGSLILGCQFAGNWNTTDQSVCNALMASSPHHPFWEGVERSLAGSQGESVIHATGPAFLTGRVFAHQHLLCSEGRLTIHGPERLYPFRWDSAFKTEASRMALSEIGQMFPEAWAVNFWTGTWVKGNDAGTSPAPPALQSTTEIGLARLIGEPPNNPFPRILVGVCSCATHEERRRAVRETWLSKSPPGVQVVFFMGGDVPLKDETDVVVLPVEDSYELLSAKVHAFFRWAIREVDFDWLFKCDDDTYLVLERLHSIVPRTGRFVGAEFQKDSGYVSGGAGYLLARKVVEALAADQDIPKGGCEDVVFSTAALHHGHPYQVSDKLCCDCSRQPRQDNDLVTCHWCSPAMLRMVYALFSQAPIRAIRVAHPFWHDIIELLQNNYFVRKTSGCAGTWEARGDGCIVLNWFAWPPEIFELVPAQGDGFYRLLDQRVN